MSDFQRKLVLAAAMLLSLSALPVHAAVKRTLCVYDPIGANGDVYGLAQDYRAAARAWGVNFKLEPYTDEGVAVEDFKAGQCDAALITGIRDRKLVRFAGSVDMMGAIPTYRELRTVIRTISQPKAAKYMRSGPYEVAGVLPAGAVYLFVSSKTMQSIKGTPTVKDLAGKTIATLSYDQQAVQMVRFVGASVVGSDITNFGSKFNNGSADICYAPAYAYKALELYKGLGKHGGIIDYVLAQLTYQMVTHRKEFSGKFLQKSRDWAANHFDQALAIAKRSEAQIPKKYWIHIPKKDRRRYQQMFRNVRLKLRKEGGVYSPRMMKLLWKVRCHYHPSDAECSESPG
ncbi:MAG TPA: putative solute-binding protein [Gammaproteobacteria bacterium]|nr:putative solute-binding protein [Gammaproteobacteria bacterium]